MRVLIGSGFKRGRTARPRLKIATALADPGIVSDRCSPLSRRARRASWERTRPGR